MLNLSLNIRNPFKNKFEILKCWEGSTPVPNKFWEIQINKTNDILGIDVRFTIRQNHAGIFLSLSLFSYEIIFNFYDHRHWNSETNSWEVIDS